MKVKFSCMHHSGGLSTFSLFRFRLIQITNLDSDYLELHVYVVRSRAISRQTRANNFLRSILGDL